MTTYASELILRVAADILDTAYDRWSLADHLSNLNAGERQLIFFKPSAKVKTESVRLVAGTRQSVPSSGVEFISLERNMGLDGKTAGATILPASPKDMNELYPEWRSDTASATAIHYMFDDQNREKFEVYPQQPSANRGYVEIVYSYLPNNITKFGTTEVIGNYQVPINLADEYQEPLYNYMMFAAYRRNAASSMYDAERAVAYWNLFLAQVGRKDLVETQYPKRRPDQYGNSTQSVS
jgi:hypothetical protein